MRPTIPVQETTTPGGADGVPLDELLGRLTLEEQVRLLTGQDFWTTHPLPSIGLRPIVTSDGPTGVRGRTWDERSPSLCLPSATCLSATWDLDLARRYGAVLAAEARRKGVDVVLGPTVNLHRSPLGGRHFEAFSEDPLLTAELAAAYVTGLQEHGVAATPKHYVANDSETDRFTVDVRVDERTLREVYLLPFERAVAAGAWLVMSAYNSVEGTTMTEHGLLADPLVAEWGFDGVVVGDWTAVRTLDSARAAQDLVMPGPGGPWGDALVAAVREGRIERSAIEEKVRRLLRLAARVGALGDAPAPAPAVPAEDGRALARRVAAAGSVLLRNDGELPWAGAELRRVAVIGQNAERARIQGGGSATVLPEEVTSPLDGLRAALPGAEVTHSLGAVVQRGVAELPPDRMRNPVTGGPGLRVRFLDADGREVLVEDRAASSLVWHAGTAPVDRVRTVELTTRYLPAEGGRVRLGFASVGRGRVSVDGRLLLEETTVLAGTDPGAAQFSPPTATAPVELVAGEAVDLRLELEPARDGDVPDDVVALTLGTEHEGLDAGALVEQAAAAARAADVAVVVVGTSSQVESEGFDREDLALPGAQDELVRAVARANPRTVVVVNAGAPVELPWRDEVAAVLVTWFGGQEYGHALADVLLGVTEPGGRLPTTWPGALADVPVREVTPTGGVLRYDEGVHVGHRAWLRAGREPAFAFGAGLGYTTWRLDAATVHAPEGADPVVRVRVTNTGGRAGRHVVQVYASRPASAVDRPARWLVGWAGASASAGETVAVEVPVPRRALAHWDGGWRVEPGSFTLHVGSSVLDTPLACPLDVD